MRILVLICLVLLPRAAEAQRTVGQVRIEVRDPAGAPTDATGTLESDSTQIRRSFEVDSSGVYVAIDLPFGVYRVEITRAGFDRHVSSVDVRSALPVTHTVTLVLAGFSALVNVSAEPDTILDPFRGAPVRSIGADLLRDRPSAPPGRSLIDVVNTQPGWLLEANAILHPRGSEYQVQYVIDGIPLRDNRSPAFAQSLGVEEFESMTLRTAGYPRVRRKAWRRHRIEHRPRQPARLSRHGVARSRELRHRERVCVGPVLERQHDRRIRPRASSHRPLSRSAERGQLHQPR
jgi:hypothetical protein